MSIFFSKNFLCKLLFFFETFRKPLEALQSYREAKINLRNNNTLATIRELFKGTEREKFFDYISEQNTNANTYLDYLKACTYLGLDMSLPKNRFPHDFKHWHDMRIDQYRSAKALKDEEERKELYAKFGVIAEKYLALQKSGKDAFAVIIAHSPQDFIREGDILHHCVGRMNYDQKFVREESFIFFVRNATAPDIPFVTLEYSLTSKKYYSATATVTQNRTTAF